MRSINLDRATVPFYLFHQHFRWANWLTFFPTLARLRRNQWIFVFWWWFVGKRSQIAENSWYNNQQWYRCTLHPLLNVCKWSAGVRSHLWLVAGVTDPDICIWEDVWRHMRFSISESRPGSIGVIIFLYFLRAWVILSWVREARQWRAHRMKASQATQSKHSWQFTALQL